VSDRIDEMPNDTKTDLLRRVATLLADGKKLIYEWQKTVTACEDCKHLEAETAPYMAGLNSLLKELGLNKAI